MLGFWMKTVATEWKKTTNEVSERVRKLCGRAIYRYWNNRQDKADHMQKKHERQNEQPAYFIHDSRVSEPIVCAATKSHTQMFL